ncbi:unnamed protein product, partial [Soboliphyme baturini]|uniref:Tetraspanin-17 n=1 Tax=Soboliphyme baturini TaxID=241478 RepID=A0A183IUY0_9BILA
LRACFQIYYNVNGYIYDLVHRRYGREHWVTDLLDTVQFYQKCCGANGTTDYMFSYWQINNSPGTIHYVPESCCTQRDDAHPPSHLMPIDDRCKVEYYVSFWLCCSDASICLTHHQKHA